ncbi:MAG TPA: MarR family transcriptional regulator [Acidimicrobiales bacterium]|jgi:DNA-binding MarR family transcriptional regulator
MLDRLERTGFIMRSAHPTDRRKTIVCATSEAAQQAHGLLAPLLEDATQQLLSGHAAEQLRLITDFLNRSGELQQRHVERLRAMRATPPTSPG